MNHPQDFAQSRDYKFPIYVLLATELILVSLFVWGDVQGYKLLFTKFMMVAILVLIAWLVTQVTDRPREPSIREIVGQSHQVRRSLGPHPSGMALREVFFNIGVWSDI